MSDNKEFVEAFVAESRDYFDEVDPDLMSIKISIEEGRDFDVEIVNRLFRSFHSTKGTAAFLGFTQLVSLTHQLETILDHFRTHTLKPTISSINLIFEVCDFLKEMIDIVEETLSDEGKEEQIIELIQKLESLVHENGEQEECFSEDDSVVLDLKLEITPEMRNSFLEESLDLLDLLEQYFLSIQSDASQHDVLIPEAFRSIHSFKGNCGLFDLKTMEEISHLIESVLDKARNKECRLNARLLGIFLEAIDHLKNGVAAFSEGKEADIAFVCDYISENLEGFDSEQGGNKISHSSKIGDILVNQGKVKPEDLEKALIKQQAPLGEILTDMGAVKKEDLDEALKKQENSQKNTSSEASSARVQRQDVRVDVSKLDSLINLVGELVISQIMVTQHKDLQGLDIPEFDKSAHHLNRITSDLQDIAMSVRMVPVSGLFKKMLRLVHDTAAKAGKKVRLETIGEDTEMDRTVLELIADPMVHLIRNSVDHGVDTAEARKVNGKPETGLITLEARHEGGEVWIIIKDDGRGMNKEKILQRGIERGLVQGDGSDMKDKDIFKLILEPGFSTAETITSISGRGVGMDVVKKNITRMQGRVDIHSVEGEGATIILKIPLTLAIIEGMMVQVGKARYIIPIPIIKESLRPEKDQLTVTPDGIQLVKIKGKFVPIVRLDDIFHIQREDGFTDGGLFVVVDSFNGSVALCVDEILGQHQTVIKSLSGYLGNVQGFSGCTILSDGEICLIIDINSLLSMAHTRQMSERAEDSEKEVQKIS